MRPLRFLIILAAITAVLAIVPTPSSAVEPGDVLINEVAFLLLPSERKSDILMEKMVS